MNDEAPWSMILHVLLEPGDKASEARKPQDGILTL